MYNTYIYMAINSLIRQMLVKVSMDTRALECCSHVTLIIYPRCWQTVSVNGWITSIRAL